MGLNFFMAKQFVTFYIDDYLLGIDILAIREINRVLEITPVQHAPDYVLGLINLRGQTITVFDLGIRLGFEKRNITPDSHNIIFKTDTVGLLVDRIGDVVTVDEEEIEPPPANMWEIEIKFVENVIKLKNEILMIISAQKILEYKNLKIDRLEK